MGSTDRRTSTQRETAIQWCDSVVDPARGSCRLQEATTWADLTGTDRLAKPWLSGLPRLILISAANAPMEPRLIDYDCRPGNSQDVPHLPEREIIDAARSKRGVRHRWLWHTSCPRQLDRVLASNHSSRETIPSNLWIGTPVTGRESLRQVARLTSIGGRKTTRFVIVQPLREEVSLADFLDDLHWVLIDDLLARDCDLQPPDYAWIGRLVDQCRNAGVPIFVDWRGRRRAEHENCTGLTSLTDSSRRSQQRYPTELRIHQIPVARIHGRILAKK